MSRPVSMTGDVVAIAAELVRRDLQRVAAACLADARR
jgi:hypothetical protein